MLKRLLCHAFSQNNKHGMERPQQDSWVSTWTDKILYELWDISKLFMSHAGFSALFGAVLESLVIWNSLQGLVCRSTSADVLHRRGFHSIISFLNFNTRNRGTLLKNCNANNKASNICWHFCWFFLIVLVEKCFHLEVIS